MRDSGGDRRDPRARTRTSADGSYPSPAVAGRRRGAVNVINQLRIYEVDPEREEAFSPASATTRKGS